MLHARGRVAVDSQIHHIERRVQQLREPRGVLAARSLQAEVELVDWAVAGDDREHSGWLGWCGGRQRDSGAFVMHESESRIGSNEGADVFWLRRFLRLRLRVN